MSKRKLASETKGTDDGFFFVFMVPHRARSVSVQHELALHTDIDHPAFNLEDADMYIFQGAAG